MAKTKTDELVKIQILVSNEEEDRFVNFIERNKYKTQRLAFVGLLNLAEKQLEEKGSLGEEEKMENMEGKKICILNRSLFCVLRSNLAFLFV